MFGVEVYEKGHMTSDATLHVNDVRVMISGTLDGAQILEIGHKGVLHLTYVVVFCNALNHLCQTGGPPRLFMWPAKLKF